MTTTLKNTNLYKLYRIHCADLLVLAEMEWQGMKFNRDAALEEASRLNTRLSELNNSFKSLCGNRVVDINSGKHVSAVLYGGELEETVKIVCGVYKSGDKKGLTKYKNESIIHKFERLVSPLDKTEVANSKKSRDAGKTEGETQWSVGEDILLKLKAKGKAKELIKIILEYRELYKLKSTYLEGWSKLIESQCWKDNYIHGNLNQCVAVTGRLSSSKPNMQNCDKRTKQFLVSRYDC